MKKTTALLLAVLMMALAVLVSCAENADEGGDESKNVETEGTVTEAPEGVETEGLDVTEEVPEMTFSEGVMNFLIFNTDYIDANHVFDEPSDDPVDLAKYNMIVNLENRFGIDIVEHIQSYDYVNVQYRNMIKAGANDFQVIFPDDLHAHYFAEEGSIYDYDSLVYIDLEKDYWDQSLLDYTTVGDKVYYAYGTYDFTYYDLTHCLVFNKKLVSDFGLDNPYDLVNEGKWTMDEMFAMMQKATYDYNFDGQMGLQDAYGYISSSKQVLPDFWIAGGTTTVKLDDDNFPVLNIQGNEHLQNIIDKCFTIFWDGGVWYPSLSPNGNQSEGHEQFFESDRALFADYTFYYLNQLRDCESEFGILPFPKYDHEQNSYYSRVEAGCTVALVPNPNPYPEEAGALIEAMAAEGYRELLPAYYESVLKRKVSRDEESLEMLDHIFNTRVYDLGDTWYCEFIRDGMFRLMFNDNKNTLSSYYMMYRKMVQKTIDTTIEAYTK